MLVCLWTTGALAYNASFPNTAKWTTLTQTFSVANEPSFIGTSATSATMTAIQNAAASWTNLPACNFTYSSPVSGVYVTNTYLDTVSNTSNNIVFLDFSTNASFITRTAALGYSNLTNTAAWTNIRTNPNVQTQIQEADIYVNTYLPIQADPSPVTGKWDLKTIMLNQFGTALGLNRITQTAQGALSQPTYKITKTFFPVMQLTLTRSGSESYPLTTGLTAVQRTYLSKDDKQGAAALYPKTPSTLTGTAVNTAGKIITSDLDNDGLDDIVYIDTLGYCYYTVDLKNWTRIGTNKFSQIVNADLNADGDEDDLAGINLNQYIIYSTDMSSWAKSGENKFSQVVAFDQDDNGVRDDLAGVNLNSYIVYTTNIAATAWSKSGNNKFSSFVAFDQDGSSANGKDDLVGVNLNQYAVYATDITGEWSKSGQNKFSSLISADIDVDGDFDDLVGVNLNQYAVYSTSITATDWSK
ncbi:MAG: hypothetical protein GY868_02965, partial [Deltaproteobacteria bacterium]|nr:hypothetical protein [Deltaproteobacteria bacterium]